MRTNNSYDVIIIGAGIGGLVCGCYLAKFGKKVLIVERQDKPGGCCTSFTRGDYTFDVGVHYLGSCRPEGGIIYKILKDFGILENIGLKKMSPHDLIKTPGETVYFSNDVGYVKEQLNDLFPKEKDGVESFFDLILKSDLIKLKAKLRGKTYKELLDEFFVDQKVKSIFSIPIGNIGAQPSRVSAFISAILLKEYVFDGGYYLEGGVQNYPDALARKLVELGGEIKYNTEVCGVDIKDNHFHSIVTQKKEQVFGGLLVSNIDARILFGNLINVECDEKHIIEKMEGTFSAYVVYLGVNKPIEKYIGKNLCSWIFNTYDIEECYDIKKNYCLGSGLENKSEIDYIICHFPSLVDPTISPPNKHIIRVEVWVTQNDISDWSQKKNVLYKHIIKQLEKLIPNIEDSIEVCEIATPATIQKWVNSRNGVIFGWAPTPSQERADLFPFCTSIQGVYLAGGWALTGFGQCGIPVVSLSGMQAARTIIRQIKKYEK